MSISQPDLEKMTPLQAKEKLMEGNRRFISGQPRVKDLKKQVQETASGQFPFAAILGCIDSRASAEQVFDQGIGDIFNARVAGNIVNPDILGSLEFACIVIGSKLILVLGHTNCGAVTSACNNVELGNITAMLSNIKPVLEGFGPDPDVDEVAAENVRNSVSRIRKESSILAGMESDGKILIKGAMYDVSSGQVNLLD